MKFYEARSGNQYEKGIQTTRETALDCYKVYATYQKLYLYFANKTLAS